MRVATLICSKHLEMGTRCLSTLISHCADPVELSIFEDGSLTGADMDSLRRAFPNARLIKKIEREELVQENLKEYPQSRQRREQNPLVQKLIDIPLQMEAPYLFCDTDILFFRRFTLQSVWNRPHYIAPLKALCNRKFKSRFFAQSEDDSSARTVGH